jgi:hypothetical protein
MESTPEHLRTRHRHQHRQTRPLVATLSFGERIWKSIKSGEVSLHATRSASEVRTSIGHHLALCNSSRPHSSPKALKSDQEYSTACRCHDAGNKMQEQELKLKVRDENVRIIGSQASCSIARGDPVGLLTDPDAAEVLSIHAFPNSVWCPLILPRSYTPRMRPTLRRR